MENSKMTRMEMIKNKNDFSDQLNAILKDWKVTDTEGKIMNNLES